jgi:hypothetical protein
MKKIFSAILIVLIFTTSSFLSEGYLCFQNLQANRLCKCNHSSAKEIHKTSNHNILLPEHESNYKTSENLPNCHNSNITSSHICSCKTTENTLESFLLQKSIMYLPNFFELSYSIEINRSFFSEKRYVLSSGFRFIITPPPKLI